MSWKGNGQQGQSSSFVSFPYESESLDGSELYLCGCSCIPCVQVSVVRLQPIMIDQFESVSGLALDDTLYLLLTPGFSSKLPYKTTFAHEFQSVLIHVRALLLSLYVVADINTTASDRGDRSQTKIQSTKAIYWDLDAWKESESFVGWQ